MGMGSFGVHSFVIEYDDIKKICPDEIKAIENAKYFDSIGWNSIGRWLAWDDPDQIQDAIKDSVLDDESDPIRRLQRTQEQIEQDVFDQYKTLVRDLKDVFNQKTRLCLYFDYYDEDNGDRYDNPGDKEGCIFCVDGMVQLSPAGEKFKDIIFERSWTQFG